MKDWDKDLETFIKLAWQFDIKMLMVGGGAVNFHGYQRHSADVDFWIDISKENLNRLKDCLNSFGYDFDDFPNAVKSGSQNISLKFSPQSAFQLELITNFNALKSFDEAYASSQLSEKGDLKWKVISLEDLITSKIKLGRPSDEIDIIELKRANNL